MSDTQAEQPTVVLRRRIREWAMSLPEHPRWQWLRDEMIEVAGAAADDSAKASDEERPRSTVAPGWASLAEYIDREIGEARASRDMCAKLGNKTSAQYWDGKAHALDELWNVFAAELQAPPNVGADQPDSATRAPESKL